MSQRPSSSTRLADDLASDIHSGKLGPGSWLKQVDIQERYGATRLDVRKALDQLVIKRLIEHIPNRGYHVHVPDPVRLDEIRDVRILLECGALEDVIKHITAKQLKHIEDLARKFDMLTSTGTLLEQYAANQAFHQAVYALCKNRELVRLIHDIKAGTPAAPTTQWVNHARVQQSAKEHFDLVAALRERDLKQAQAVVRQHIQQSEGT
ncbi:transcriptional regulator [Advenella kashmirensis W13003]|uniref:Transcriptional regulator n=1 Tax=Advenella kashmirensis W13003 TaxID=1424334 RepID=V8QMJ0_9BURK|nr:GntR family transcriptional regulator [Advenella kashmirensis]ETF00518.1 transcriptional regulator [Advenella kashmirensis W13003]